MPQLIIIPAKGKSIRCPNKNIYLIPPIVDYIKTNSNLFDSTVLLTDSDDLINIAKVLGLKYYKEYPVGKSNELLSIYNYLLETNTLDYYNAIIHLASTQPIREPSILKTIYNLPCDSNLITTYIDVPDRSIFYIKDGKFENKTYNKTGSMCQTKNMVDGSIYKISTAFIKNVINKSKSVNDINHYFWNTKNIKFIKQNCPFVDIDTKLDLQNYLYFYK